MATIGVEIEFIPDRRDVESAEKEIRGALRAEPNHAIALSILARLALGEFEKEEVDSILEKVMGPNRFRKKTRQSFVDLMGTGSIDD